MPLQREKEGWRETGVEEEGGNSRFRGAGSREINCDKESQAKKERSERRRRSKEREIRWRTRRGGYACVCVV